MMAMFREEKKRKFNKFNKKSLKMRYGDFDYDDFEIITIYDDEGSILLDAEIYCPQDKAYIILNRVHLKEKSIDRQKEVLEQFIGYLLCPTNLNYFASAIYVNIVGFNIAEDVAQEIGFFPKTPNIFALLNWSFEEILEGQNINGEVREVILEDYSALKAKKLAHREIIRTQLAEARNALQYFITNNPQSIMIDSKRLEIQYLERVLLN